MAEQLREGNYSRFGASVLADGICFTFEGEKDSNCAVRLYEKHKGTEMADAYRDIPVSKEYCIGAVRSVCVSGLDVSQYDYNYVVDGKVVVDPYARRIIGRENGVISAARRHIMRCAAVLIFQSMTGKGITVRRFRSQIWCFISFM